MSVCVKTEHDKMSTPRNQTRPPEETPRCPAFATLQARKDTAPTNLPDGINARRIAELGFFFTGDGTRLRCFYCGIETYLCWKSWEEAVLVHVIIDEDCHHLHDTVDPVTLQTCTMLAHRAILTGCEIFASENRAYEVECRSDNRTQEQRLQTFAKWPSNTQDPIRLAEAGFIYTGNGDRTRCFSCNGGLWKWDAEDDPWIEHARWYPNCAHVRSVKGEEYVRRIQQQASQKRREGADVPETRHAPDNALKSPTDGHVENLDFPNPDIPLLESSTEENLDLPNPDLPLLESSTGLWPSEEVIEPWTTELGHPVYRRGALLLCQVYAFSRRAVREAIEQLRGSGSAMTWAAVRRMLQERVARGDRLPADPDVDGSIVEELDDIHHENQILRQLLLCRKCDDRRVSTVFLPCGHLVACDECATVLLSCPICGVNIKERVRAYMA